MMLWQTIEFFAPLCGVVPMALVTFWYACRYLLNWNTCWHEAEFEKEKAVRE